MIVLWIDTPTQRPDGKHFGYPFEVACESIEDFVNRIAAERIIGGHQLITVDDGRGGKLVQKRRPLALTPAGIARVTLYDKRVWEPDDAPASQS